jgi:hypothetical protein
VIFKGIFDRLHAADQTAFRTRLSTIAVSSGIGRQVEANIWLETKLPEAAANDIVLALCACADSVGSIRDAYKRSCATSRLQGSVIAGKRPTVLGRAVPVDPFCRRLVALGKFRSARHAEAWLRRQLGLSSTLLATGWTDIALGGTPTWGTFAEPDRDTNPFRALSPTATWLHDALALDPKTRGNPLLLFVYRPPSDLDLRFPTIADAGWGRLFRPAINDPNCSCGWTAPNTDDETVRSLPEVVHEPLFGDTLCDRLEIVL